MNPCTCSALERLAGTYCPACFLRLENELTLVRLQKFSGVTYHAPHRADDFVYFKNPAPHL